MSIMIHEKYFEIMKNYLGNLNRAWHGRELEKRITLSQKTTAMALKELEGEGILESKKKGNIKNYFLNKRNKNLKDILILVEILNKIRFLKKYKILKEIFGEDERIVGIFGSYAKGTQTEESDIDVFVIGKEIQVDYGKKAEMYDLNVSIKYFSKKEFVNLLKQKNNLIKEIVRHHILISGFERFIKSTWRDYYGFD